LLFNMERLFEAFVGEKLRREWQRNRGSHRLLLQGPPEYLGDSPSGTVFRLRPDAALVSLSGKVARLYDAKWKALDRRILRVGVPREDVYQLATYAAAYGSPVVSLIYPQQTGFPDGLVEQYDLRVPGSPRLEIVLLNLGAIARGGTLPSALRSFANPATTEAQELGAKLNAE
jgi:5-methylcytosine-specific restriction endonuclease McrBC regulatory subunit McrC